VAEKELAEVVLSDATAEEEGARVRGSEYERITAMLGELKVFNGCLNPHPTEEVVEVVAVRTLPMLLLVLLFFP
jgi:hypothetical protein